jgi:hypothetical protein
MCRRPLAVRALNKLNKWWQSCQFYSIIGACAAAEKGLADPGARCIVSIARSQMHLLWLMVFADAPFARRSIIHLHR